MPSPLGPSHADVFDALRQQGLHKQKDVKSLVVKTMRWGKVVRVFLQDGSHEDYVLKEGQPLVDAEPYHVKFGRRYDV